MFSAISLSSFLIPPNTRPLASIEGRCQLEEADEDYRFQITVCFEGRCAFQGALQVKKQVKTCRVELQFPLFSKMRLASAFRKNQFEIKLVYSGTKDELILLLFCEKLMKDARKYVTFLNKENLLESSHPSSVGLEANCSAEDREVKQQFLLFLIKCSGMHRIEKEPYFREFSEEVLKGAPYASINAMAILIRMQYSFYEEDLRGVNLSRANLEEAMLYGAKLTGGNLERARLHNTCLHGTDLREARMSQVDTGRKPSIAAHSEITSWDILPNERFLVIGTLDGDLFIWDLEKDITSVYIRSSTIVEGHFDYPSAYLSNIKHHFYIECVKFINDHKILVLDSFGFLGLWSIVDSTLLSVSPTILALPYQHSLPSEVDEEISKLYKDTSVYSLSSVSLRNFYCYKNGSNPLQEDSNDTYHFLISIAGYFKHTKLIIQTGKIVEDRIKISGNSLPSTLEIRADDSQGVGVCIYSNNKAFFGLSPSGWIAVLTHENEGRTILKFTSIKGHQEILFSSEEKICKLKFTADDLELIGLIKTSSISKLVKWSTDNIYPQTVLPQEILPIPEYQELFQITGDMKQFELPSNKPYCVYTVGAVIYVRNLNTNKIIYHVEINPPHAFKLLFRKGLLLTLQNNKSYLEVRKVNLAISDFPKPAYEGSEYMFFTRDSRYLITRPQDKSLRGCLSEENGLSHIDYKVRPLLSNLKKCLDYLAKSQYRNVKYMFSPLFHYAVLMNSDIFYLWHIEKGQGIDPFKKGPNNLWNQLINYLYKDKYSIEAIQQTLVDLSDDLFLAIAYKKHMVVIDLRDAQFPQEILKLSVSHQIRCIKLLKNESQLKALFYTLKNKVVRRGCCLKKTKLNFRGHIRKVLAFDTSYDNRLLISSGKDRTIRLWNISTGEQLDCVHTLSIQSNLKFAPNDLFIAAYSLEEDKAYLWEVKDAKLKVLSILPKELGCRRANFKNAIVVDEGNKKLFKQLGGLNIGK